jgi:AcrR family transcriptional regulator
MPYSPEHKQDTRERILESARRLFNSKGFSEFSIEEVMTHAGPTHGGFYRHFSGKDEVYAEAVRHFVCKRIPGPWQAKQSASGAGKTCGEDRRRLLLATSFRRPGVLLPAARDGVECLLQRRGRESGLPRGRRESCPRVGGALERA